MLSSAAYGHTGWTGTEMWVDPERDVFVVFLANRSFDSRARHSLRAMAEVRAAVSDAVARAVPVGVVGLES
jgi:CubicO group peptidase (beta-lactamase class C family)